MAQIRFLVFLMIILCFEYVDCIRDMAEMYEKYQKMFHSHDPVDYHVHHHNHHNHHKHPHKYHHSNYTYDNQEEWCTLPQDTECCGTHQSPVRLDSFIKPVPMKPFEFINYKMLPWNVEIANNGRTVSVFFNNVNAQVKGGGLKHTYNLYSLIFHWGSEHVVNKVRAPLELQLIHYNSKFSDVHSAVESGEPDALAIIAVFYWLGRDAPEAVHTITSELTKVWYKNKMDYIPPFNLRELLPQSTTHFYRYNGSMTTPNCNEVVVWTVFKDPNFISLIQLKKFYAVKTVTKRPAYGPDSNMNLLHNYRKTQELYNRTVVLGEVTVSKFTDTEIPAVTVEEVKTSEEIETS
uniref:carbonic anhydrase n=1 Tax=Strigamia maritima TaxID=126957 RepID=T1J5K0_STRMM